MNKNLEFIESRLAVHESQLKDCEIQIKEAANAADFESFERAERLKKRVQSEINALTEMRKFYSGEHE